ncbi:MAG: YdiY family protein [Leptospirillia bacterium]
MNILRLVLVAWISTTLLATTTRAQEPPTSEWSGDAELGVVITGGNTETQNISAKAEAVTEREKWRHTGKFEMLNTTDGNTTTAERYLASGKSDLKLSEHNYLFGSVVYEKDLFSGFEYRVNETVGYGRRVKNTPTLKLDLEIGAGARHSKEENTGDHQDEALGRLAGNLKWTINTHSKFTEDVTIDIGEESTVSRSVTALKNQLAGSLATKLTFTYKHTSDVPAGVENADYETAITLVYSF